MTDYGTSNKSAGAGGHSGPPLHRDFVSGTNRVHVRDSE
jgi:hypothetical protein